jgi:WS/DGAT/MGAT family acyltransferase
MTRPLWEVNVIDGVDAVEGVPEGSVAVTTKIHHSAIDGMSGAEVFAAIHDLEPTPREPEEDHWEPEEPPPATQLLTRATINNMTRPWRFVRTVGRSVPMLARAIDRTRKHEIEGPVAQAPHTRFNEQVSPNKVLDGRYFELDDIKRIRKQADGATVNDAVITIVGGALRAYLGGKGELPDDSLMSFAPISVRAEGAAGEAGNKVSGMFSRLHSEIADPIERLEAVSASCRDAKSLHQTIGATILTDYTEFGPMRLAGLAARVSSRTGLLGQIGLPVNCVVTNVPGPQFPLYLAGAKAVRLYGTAPIMDYLGLMHAIFSYDGGLTITFTACRTQLPDPSHYADCIQHSFDALMKAS